jgi:hypothetical protein
MNVMSTFKRKAITKKRLSRSVPFEDGMSPPVAPTQQVYAELSEAVRLMSGTRDSEALVRLAMGEELQDVAIDFGVSRERVRQIAARERGRLVKRAAGRGRVTHA